MGPYEGRPEGVQITKGNTMKIHLTFKTPDVLDDAQVTDVTAKDTGGLIGAAEMQQLTQEACAKWVEYGEYLRVVIDTRKGTCTVQPV